MLPTKWTDHGNTCFKWTKSILITLNHSYINNVIAITSASNKKHMMWIPIIVYLSIGKKPRSSSQKKDKLHYCNKFYTK